MESKQVQLYLDREKTIEASPVTSADCVMLTDGNNLQNALDNDLTTPTVVHEETSFKVGQGDIDVSGSIVDGEVGRMVIRGQTYQNILPEPSLRNSMTNGKTMQKINEGYDSVEVVDGNVKSAILKGQTLVNLFDTDLVKFANSRTIVENGVITIPIVNHLYNNFEIPKDKCVGFKPSTTYTLIVDMIENNGQAQEGETEQPNSFCLASYSYSNSIVKSGSEGYYTCVIPHRTTGRFVGTFTTHDKDVYDEKPNGIQFVLGTFYSATQGQQKLSIVILEGDYTNEDIPYFEGMQSVKMPVLTTTGKNLADITKLKTVLEEKPKITEIGDNEYKIVVDGTWDNHGVCWRVKIKAGETIYFKTTVKGISNVRLYDGTGNTYLQKGYTSTDINIYEDVDLSYTASQDMDVMCRYWINDNWIGYIKSPYIAINNSDYEPFKSNILTTPEDLELRGIGEVKDELNLLTGELTQRIGEIVFDGGENISDQTVNTINHTRVMFKFPQLMMLYGKSICSHTPIRVAESHGEWEYCLISNDTVYLQLSNSKLETPNVDGVRKYMAQQYQLGTPITIHYQLAEKVVKTVDLSSSGNWNKVVLDGSESWAYESSYLRFYTPVADMVKTDNYLGKMFCDNPNFAITANYGGMKDAGETVITGYNDAKNTYPNNNWIYITVKSATSTAELKQYLQQNPITVWYQTTTNQDSTNVKEMLSFSNGHVQLSSAEGSLIPSLTYEAPTSNSYQLDLAKPSTKYTMKAKSASGAFTIDGTQYNFNTNGTFTTPSTMNNKLMITNGTVADLMFIEGDVTSKTIPYFKGIKSAFEDEDKIEVLSTGKNLLDKNLIVNEHASGNYLWTKHYNNQPSVSLKPKTTYTLYLSSFKGDGRVYLWEKGVKSREIGIPNEGLACSFTTTDLEDGFSFYASTSSNGDTSTVNVWLEQSTGNSTYEPYKSNSTKIPLLSPLRSLPNGVCDELIIDRMKKKATLIQRVGVISVNGSENWSNFQIASPTDYVIWADNQIQCGGDRHFNNICNTFPVNPTYDRSKENCYVAYSNQLVFTPFTGRFQNAGEFKRWLSQNPTTVYYQRGTPVVTEIDLENFPLVYKDGHIFLNSEIAPVVEIDYNVNQAQQIQANNETLQRHELDILDLDNLIVSFVNAEYNLRLLKFDMELSMMALAE